MSKDMGKLINRKSINIVLLSYFSYISSLVIAQNTLFSQSMLYITPK